jgi:hypothetical protein
MYVYKANRDGDIQFVVGFYDPQGQWHTESDHVTRESAAERVHYLNGNG